MAKQLCSTPANIKPTDASVDSQPCGHPPQYATLVAGEMACEWCDEVDSLEATCDELQEQIDLLQKTNETLRQIIEKKAVIVNDGSPTIEGPIGYLEIRGGSVNIGPIAAVNVKETVDWKVPDGPWEIISNKLPPRENDSLRPVVATPPAIR